MKKKLFLFATAIGLVTLASCKKDEEPKPLTRAQILTSHEWRLEEEIQVNSSGTYITNQANIFPCNKDDFQTFQTDGILIYDAGAEKCDPINPQINKAHWALTDNDSTLKIADSSNQIIELNENKLIYRYSNTNSSGTYTITTTLVKR